MSYFEDRHLDFVLRHYKKGIFDTGKAIERFKASKGIKPRINWRRNITTIGISVAAAVIVGVFLFTGLESRQWTEITATADRQSIILPDGSDITMTNGSTLSYKIKDRREIKMSGKIYFDVARDEERPFEINAEGGFVRVMGTEFMIDASGNETNVYVNDGKVLFAKNSKTEGVILSKGMGASIDKSGKMPVIDEVPDINSIAWQRGSFIFDHTPLKDVLNCLSEYYHVSFAATDLSKELSGEFNTDNLDLIIELIESALDVTIIRKN